MSIFESGERELFSWQILPQGIPFRLRKNSEKMTLHLLQTRPGLCVCQKVIEYPRDLG